jgi:hypothetical protein
MVLNLFVQAGLAYVPPGRENLRFNLGYVFEHWWSAGSLGDDSNAGMVSNSRGEFGAQGVFLRAQWDF